MKAPTQTNLKKYLAALKKMKRKTVTCELLSQEIGIYPEVIAQFFAYFDPMVRMDQDYNLMEFIPAIEKQLKMAAPKKSKVSSTERVNKKEWQDYGTIATFVYRKMTTAGIVDQSVELSDKDLRLLKKLIIEEEKERKKRRG